MQIFINIPMLKKSKKDIQIRLLENSHKLYTIHGIIASDFILGGSKITADGDCSHEI